MNFLFKLKLRGLEKKLGAAQRVSYVTEEPTAIRLLNRVTKAYNEGDYRGAVVAGYEVITRYDDLNTAYFFLAKSLEKLGEKTSALRYYWAAVAAGRKALDTFDDQQVDEMLRLAAELGRLDGVRKAFEDMGARDSKTKKYLERLQRLGKL